MRWGLVTLVVVLATGLAGTAVTLAEREGDTRFEYRQQNPDQLVPADVEEGVGTAPEPVEEPDRTPSTATRCQPAGTGELRNPWRCRVRYRSGRAVSYRVTVGPDGSYRGVYRGRVTFAGCCIRTPGD